MRFRWSIGRSAAAFGAIIAILTLGASFNAAPASTLTTLYTFCSSGTCRDGWHPSGTLVRDSAGHLLGTTEFGGAEACGYECGVVYKITSRKKGWPFKVIYEFCKKGKCGKGSNPLGGLIIDGAGNLYGAMNGGEKQFAGGIFRVSSDGKRFTVLHSFCSEENCQDGEAVENTGTGLTYQGAASGVPYDGVSPLYGVTEEGGANNRGVIFMLAPPSSGDTWTYSVLYAFCSQANCADGAYPDGLVADASGSLYGTTVGGGGNNIDQGGVGGGTVFRFAGNAYQKIYSFCASAHCSDGEYPEAVAIDQQGNLIGVTSYGGNANSGTIFRIDTGGMQQKLYDFCSQASCADGSTPTAAPFIDAAGNLFGVAAFGGANRAGVAYKFDGALHVLYNFCSLGGADCSDGSIPYSPLIPDGAGNFFGVTYGGGGANLGTGYGTVYKLTP